MKSSIVSGENRGSINNILLKALQSGDKYGYEINKEIETKSKGRYFLKEASLYSGLKRLEANGFISSYWQDGELGIRRHYYSITEKGTEKLKSSNFTWDTSKEFIDEIFQNPKVQNITNQNTLNSTNTPLINNSISFSNKNENDSIENNKLTNNTVIYKKEEPIKKNPFQYEINSMQTSLFDTFFNDKETFNSDTMEKIENKKENSTIQENNPFEYNSSTITEENSLNKALNSYSNNCFLTENKDIFKDSLDNIEINKAANETDIEKINNTHDSPKYEDLINSFSQNNYSTSLEKDSNKVDISSFLKKENKENDESIIINKKITNDNSNIMNDFDNKKVLSQEISSNSIDKSSEINTNIQKENINETTIENKTDLNLHNIFGSLLFNNESNNNSSSLMTDSEIKNDKNNEEEKVVTTKKEELPRIRLQNDVNISLSAPSVNKTSDDNYSFPNKNYFQPDERRYPSGASNNPSVKQYLNNIRSQNIISNATSISEEVNLEGFNVREYNKINNRPIKNSNYIYINKLNLFLAILFSAFIIIESAISLTSLFLLKKITVFEIVFFVVISLSMLVWLYYQIRQFNKDKFKVIIKKYNLKNNLFYTTLILIVSLVILLCINIFQGMNSNNFSDFILKFLLEFLICLNIIIYPISKFLCYKVSRFSN